MLRAEEPPSYIPPLDRLLTPTHRVGAIILPSRLPDQTFHVPGLSESGPAADKLRLVVPVVVCLQSTASAVFHVIDLAILDRSPFDSSRIGADELIQS